MTGTAQGVNSVGVELRDMFVSPDPEVRRRTRLSFDPDSSMTRQEFKDECDINILLATYEKTGAMDRFNMREPAYLDVSDVPDLASALDYVEKAQEAFMTLNAHVRREFDNDPVKFVDYASDPKNLDQMRKWGLAPEPAPKPAVPVVEPVAQPEGKPPT